MTRVKEKEMESKIKDKDREPSNPTIYKVGVGETEKHREKRIGKIEKDVTDRIQMIAQETGANTFPGLAPKPIEAQTFIRILELKGICTEEEYEDQYHILVDQRIQGLEAKKEEIKAQVIKKKAEAANTGKGIHLPPGYGNGKKLGLIKA